jgi:hypothetical protein
LIESLRLELAEAQIKLVESENMGGGRMQEVERLLLEARMTNARLMEDNESYQLLLSEKTLTGDFAKSEFMGSARHNADALSALEGRTAAPSLADELSDAAEGESDNYRRLEAELKAAKDSNKALTLYINKIIERLLQHQDFESILDSDFRPGINVDKDLPPPPPKEQASGSSILQRAKSVAMGATRRPRPQSQMQKPPYERAIYRRGRQRCQPDVQRRTSLPSSSRPADTAALTIILRSPSPRREPKCSSPCPVCRTGTNCRQLSRHEERIKQLQRGERGG